MPPTLAPQLAPKLVLLLGPPVALLLGSLAISKRRDDRTEGGSSAGPLSCVARESRELRFTVKQTATAPADCCCCCCCCCCWITSGRRGRTGDTDVTDALTLVVSAALLADAADAAAAAADDDDVFALIPSLCKTIANLGETRQVHFSQTKKINRFDQFSVTRATFMDTFLIIRLTTQSKSI